MSGPYIPSFWEFLDLCSFTQRFVSFGTCPVYHRNSLCASLLLIKLFYLSGKKKKKEKKRKKRASQCLYLYNSRLSGVTSI